MPGLPMNSLNSIEGPLSALGVMGCFRNLGEAKGGCISPLQVGARVGVGQWGAELKSLSWQVPRGLEEEDAATLGGGQKAHRGRRQRNGK